MQILTRLNKVIAYSEHDYVPVGNTAVCATSGERYDDVLITVVDYVPTDIDNYDYYYVDGKFIKGEAKLHKVLWDSKNVTTDVRGIESGGNINFNPEGYSVFLVQVNDFLYSYSIICAIQGSYTGLASKIYGYGKGTKYYYDVTLEHDSSNEGFTITARCSESSSLENAEKCKISKIVGIL